MTTRTPTQAAQSGQNSGNELPPGMLVFAVLGADQPERHAGLTPIGREMAHTLQRAITLVEGGTRAEQNPGLLMRGGKTAWLVGELDVAGSCYRAAMPQLVELAEGLGRSAGTSADYYRHALNAGWMAMTCATDEKQRAADSSALRAVVKQLHASVQRLQTNTGQSLGRLALHAARVHAGWLVRDTDLPRYFVQAEQLTTALDVPSKTAWAGGRDQLVLAAIRSVSEDRPEQHGVALAKLDAALQATAIEPPSVSELMDETLLALQAASIKRGAKLSALKLAPASGSCVQELLPLAS